MASSASASGQVGLARAGTADQHEVHARSASDVVAEPDALAANDLRLWKVEAVEVATHWEMREVHLTADGALARSVVAAC